VCGKIKGYLNVKPSYLYLVNTSYEKLKLSMWRGRKWITVVSRDKLYQKYYS